MKKWMLIFALLLYTNSLMAEVKILALSGSTRENSLNQELLNEVVFLASQMGTKIQMIDLKNYPLPIYNGDLEVKEGLPKSAKELRRLMIQSDVILIASPEYNGSLSPLLKNTIDWATRNEKGEGSREAFKGKKFIIMSASPGTGGGAKGLVHLKAIIEHIGGAVLSSEITLPKADSAFDEQKHLKSEEMKKLIEQILQKVVQ